MKQKKWIFILTILLLLVIAVLVFTLSNQKNRSQVVIVNASSQQIVSGEIEICNQHYRILKINPNEKEYITFNSKYDSHYIISIKFKTGKILMKELGYVTNGMDTNDILVVKDNDITIEVK